MTNLHHVSSNVTIDCNNILSIITQIHNLNHFINSTKIEHFLDKFF